MKHFKNITNRLYDKFEESDLNILVFSPNKETIKEVIPVIAKKNEKIYCLNYMIEAVIGIFLGLVSLYHYHVHHESSPFNI